MQVPPLFGGLPKAAGLALLFVALAFPATAQVFPRGDGPDAVDPVTGYLCVTPGCDVVRLPNANCICKKENPTERNLQRLLLTCSTREGGAWVACPVKPRYGISTN